MVKHWHLYPIHTMLV